MIEQIFRSQYQQLFIEPLLKKMSVQVQPLQCTLLSGLLGLLFIPALLWNHPWLAIVLLLASGYCDSLDGSLARYRQLSSAIGAVDDIVTVRLVDFMVVFAFYLQNPGHRSLLVILMLASILICVTSFLVVAIFTHNDSSKSFHYSPGLIERAEAFIFFILMVLLPGYFNFLALIFVVMVCLTALIRLSQFVHLQRAITDR